MALQAARSVYGKLVSFSGRNKHVVRLKFVRKKSSKCEVRLVGHLCMYVCIYVSMYVCMYVWFVIPCLRIVIPLC